MSKRSHILITVFIALLILMVMLIVAIIRDQSATELVTSLELPSTVQLKMKLQQNLYALVASVTLTVLFMITWILFHKSDDIAATPKNVFGPRSGASSITVMLTAIRSASSKKQDTPISVSWKCHHSFCKLDEELSTICRNCRTVHKARII